MTMPDSDSYRAYPDLNPSCDCPMSDGHHHHVGCNIDNLPSWEKLRDEVAVLRDERDELLELGRESHRVFASACRAVCVDNSMALAPWWDFGVMRDRWRDRLATSEQEATDARACLCPDDPCDEGMTTKCSNCQEDDHG